MLGETEPVTGQQVGVLVTLITVGCGYAAYVYATFRYVADRTPAGIVRRLFKTGQPVTVGVNPVNSTAWDPSQRVGRSGFYAPGVVTYTLERPDTVRARFQPRNGSAIERSATIPAYLLPDTPDMHRRRVVARLVTLLYVAIGAAAFTVSATVAGGTASVRLRIGAVVALVTVAISWLITDVILTRPGGRPRRMLRAEGLPVPPRHLLGWTGGSVLVAAAFAVGWHLSNSDQTEPMSWASAFLSAGVFVLVAAAIITASTYHHTYIHHQPPIDRGSTQPKD